MHSHTGSLHDAGASSTERQTKPDESEWNVTIHWTRHGQSCANAIEKYGGWKGRAKKNLFTDPSLTDCGIQRTMDAGEKFARWMNPSGDAMALDFVGSSTLLRAMQTAVFQFSRMNPSLTVYPLPFISEKNSWTLDNQAMNMTAQQTVFDAVNSRIPDGKMLDAGVMGRSSGINWSEFAKLDFSKSAFALAGGVKENSNDMTTFLAFLSHYVLPEIIAGRLSDGKLSGKANKAKADRELRLAIVSHSEFLLDEFDDMCSLSGTKPGNNDVLTVPYKFGVGGILEVSRDNDGRLLYHPSDLDYSCTPGASPVSMRNDNAERRLEQMPSKEQICPKDLRVCDEQIRLVGMHQSTLSPWKNGTRVDTPATSCSCTKFD